MKRLRRTLWAAILLSVGATTHDIAETAAQTPTEMQTEIQRLAQPYIDEDQVVGLSIGVIKGDLQATVHLGVTKEGGARPTDDTVYEIGSASKVFTGLLLADAVNQNLLRLDQPARELLPRNVMMPQGQGKPITLLNLATHDSGLPRLSDNMPFGNAENPYSDYDSKLAYEFLNQYQLTREPGDQYEYSNFGMSLLGNLVSRNAKVSYDDLLATRITKPLGMLDTAVECSPAMREQLASPYAAPGTPTSNWDFADMPGAGGIRSTTGDLLTFAKANLDPPENAAGQAIDLAWKIHRHGGPSGPNMGLGWHLADDQATRWHNGQTGGYHSMVMINRDQQAAVVLMTNTGTLEVDQLAEDVRRMLAGEKVAARKFEKWLRSQRRS